MKRMGPGYVNDVPFPNLVILCFWNGDLQVDVEELEILNLYFDQLANANKT